MKVADAIETIQTINAANGYSHCPSVVSTDPKDLLCNPNADGEQFPRMQSVLVESGGGGKVKLTINVTGSNSGYCLSQIKDHIRAKLGATAIFVDETSTIKEPDDGSDSTTQAD